jgi:peroxiredoxin
MFCREQAVQLHRELPAIRKKGAGLVFIGNGNANFAKGFKDEFEIEAPVYVDSRRKTYEALGFSRSPFSFISVGATKAAARALGAGFRQGLTQGDAFQLGGVLVVDGKGEVLFRHASQHAGDHPPVKDVLAAL